MADVAELKAELKEAQFQLRYRRPVDWSNANGGAINYSNQLARCHQLQLQIQRAEAGR